MQPPSLLLLTGQSEPSCDENMKAACIRYAIVEQLGEDLLSHCWIAVTRRYPTSARLRLLRKGSRSNCLRRTGRLSTSPTVIDFPYRRFAKGKGKEQSRWSAYRRVLAVLSSGTTPLPSCWLLLQAFERFHGGANTCSPSSFFSLLPHCAQSFHPVHVLPTWFAIRYCSGSDIAYLHVVCLCQKKNLRLEECEMGGRIERYN
jgi:hypothetical protein